MTQDKENSTSSNSVETNDKPTELERQTSSPSGTGNDQDDSAPTPEESLKLLEEDIRQRQVEEDTRQRQVEEDSRQRQVEEDTRQRQAEEDIRQRQVEEDIRQRQIKGKAAKAKANTSEPEPNAKSPKQKGAAPASQQQAPVSGKSSFSYMALFAILLSLGTLATVGFIWWQGQMWLTTQQQVDALKDQQLKNQQQTVGQLRNQINQLQAKLTQQNTNMQRYQRSIAELTNRTKELGQSQPNQWLAAEALYLVNIAERRLLVEQDVETALQLLVGANSRLTAMNDPSVFPIRQAISEDVAALHAVQQPDSDSLYLALSGLISQVQTLAFSQYYLPERQQDAAEVIVTDNLNDWQSNLKISLQRFMGNFVTISRNEHPVKPALPADQQWYVRANITQQLQMAQQAVLEQNKAIYADTVSQANEWMRQYLDIDDIAVIAAVQSLEAIQDRNVELQLPASLGSQAMLSNYVLTQKQLKFKSQVRRND